jgi:nitrate reductase gamma subunit
MDVGELPSSVHAREFLEAPSGPRAATLLVDMAGRAAIIALGLHLARRRPRAELAHDAFAAALMIELFVLAHTARNLP